MKRIIAASLMIVLAMLSAGCSRPVATSLPAAVDQHLEWIPRTAEGVIYVDLKSLRASALAKELEKDWGERMKPWREETDYRQFMEKAGFDIEKDLEQILVGMENGDHESMHSPTVIATGNFDEQKIISALDALREARREKGKPVFFSAAYGGKTISVTDDSAKAFYFADAHTVVFGKKAWVQSVIDGKTAGESVKHNEEVMALLQKLPFKNQCWMIANTTKLAERLSEELGAEGGFRGTRAMKSLQGVLFSAQVEEKAKLFGEALCDNEGNSRLLAEAAKGALATAKLAVSEDREAVDMLNRIKVELKGKSVEMRTDLDSAFFNKWLEKTKHRKAVAIR
ncbi:MAG: hypothetical protein ONA90_01340 [candidate division KSB1 bacterium]|nr:hypothetical protein [candidate division KSB1 bacterium]